MSDYYVYEHWRPDANTCFYVGKGRKKRAYNVLERNEHHRRITRKLAGLGLAVDVRFALIDATEAAAFDYEKQRIAHWRARGVELVNYTDGGDGISGYTHTPEARAVIKSKAQGRTLSDERKEVQRRARVGCRHSEETKAKMRESAKLAQKLRRQAEISTPEGRERVVEQMRKASRSRFSNPEYKIQQARAAAAANAVIKAKRESNANR